MSEDRLRIRATASSFHLKLMKLSQPNESNEEKKIEKPIEKVETSTSGRDFSILLEKTERPYFKKERKDEYFEKKEEIDEEEVEPQKKEFTPEDFPTLMTTTTQTNTMWVKDKKLTMDEEHFKLLSSAINEESTKQLADKQRLENQEKAAILEEQEREARLAEYIKKVKKQYERDYLVHNEADYLEDELQYFDDNNEPDETTLLYEEMLEETRNRDLSIQFDDPDYYYDVYDEETPFYESYNYLKKQGILA
jgi:hypothetical protein